jgi:dTDP-4-amino-4,6-dideoxygalactose transaminase
MQVPFVDLKVQYKKIKKEIDKAIGSVIKETAFIGGKYVKKFENEFALAYGMKHCISVANGTDALYITLKMLGIKEGDEVITTANSWISTSETITQAGALPIFIDIDEYYTINTNKIEEKITPNTKAIIPVHLYGQAADIEKIKILADKHKLFLIEDCAQAHFTQFNQKNVGQFGIAATFSFYPGKNLGAYGDAGAILTNDDALAEKCRMYANHGALIKHEHKMEGINSRLDGLQAAILSAKLPHLPDWTEKRIENAAYYHTILSGIKEISLPTVRKGTKHKHTFHLFVIRANNRNELQRFLKENGIETAIHYPTPLPLLIAYSYLKKTERDFPLAALYKNSILSLPMYPELTKGMMDYVAATIKKFYNTMPDIKLNSCVE